MVHEALDTLTTKLNEFLLLRLGRANVVKQENLVTQGGTVTPGLTNNIVASVVNMEEDRISRSRDTHRKQLDGTYATIKPEIRFNVYLLFTSCFSATAANSNYNEGLKCLSGVINFFQTNNVFNPKNTPSLNANIGKLVVEHYSLTLEQQNHLWGALGAKYLPSVLYKVRLFVFQEEDIQASGPPITTVEIQSQDSNA